MTVYVTFKNGDLKVYKNVLSLDFEGLKISFETPESISVYFLENIKEINIFKE